MVEPETVTAVTEETTGALGQQQVEDTIKLPASPRSAMELLVYVGLWAPTELRQGLRGQVKHQHT